MDRKLRWIRPLLLFVIALFAPFLAFPSSTPFPDWVLQAVASPSSPYPPEITAVVLLDDTLVTVGADGKAIERERRVVKILRPQGREMAVVVARYSKDEKLRSFHSWSIGPDGHQYTIKDQEVQDEALGEWGILYDDLRAKVVHAPGADPGGIVAFEVERQLATYGAQEQAWDFQGGIPVQRSVLEIDLPAGWKKYVAWLHHDALPGTEIAPNHWRWELQDIPGVDLSDVPMAPSEEAIAGRMVVHYSATDLPSGDGRWTEIGNWYDALASARTEAPQDIASKSRELVGNAETFKAKIEAVADFMQRDIRYVGIEIGIGNLQPHPAEEIFRNRHGDCKDKATLLIAMLNAVGVRATWVLVDTHRGFIDPALPSIAADHAIAAIEMPSGDDDPSLRAVVTARNGKRYLIFDPTDQYTPIGLLGFHVQASYGVLVTGQDSQVILLPKLAAETNTMSRSGNFTMDANGNMKGTIIETRSGESGRYYRKLYSEDGEKEQREYIEHRLQRDLASFTLDAADAQNIRDMTKNVVLTLSLTAPGYAKNAGDLLLFRPRIIGRNSEPVTNKPRKYPVNLGETGTWRDSFDVSLPAGYQVDDMPAPVSVDVGFASYKSEVRAGEGMLHYSREYVVRELDLAPEKYSDVKKLMAVMTADENNSAVLKKK